MTLRLRRKHPITALSTLLGTARDDAERPEGIGVFKAQSEGRGRVSLQCGVWIVAVLIFAWSCGTIEAADQAAPSTKTQPATARGGHLKWKRHPQAVKAAQQAEDKTAAPEVQDQAFMPSEEGAEPEAAPRAAIVPRTEVKRSRHASTKPRTLEAWLNEYVADGATEGTAGEERIGHIVGDGAVQPASAVGSPNDHVERIPSQEDAARRRKIARLAAQNEQFHPVLGSADGRTELLDVSLQPIDEDQPRDAEQMPLDEDEVPTDPQDRKTLEEEVAQQMDTAYGPCPKPSDLKRIYEITDDIRPSAGNFPQYCTLGNDPFVPRCFAMTTFTWKASGVCHKPLYFEQVAVERYGHTWPLIQPLVSGAHFFAVFPIFPYKLGLEAPWECIYPLGYYRPGDCAPYIIYPIPISLRAGLMEAGAWVGGVAIIP